MLYFVPTPIGNIEDTTLRAIRLFKECQLIICEDSRQIRKLLQLLEIANRPQFLDITYHHRFNRAKIQKALLNSKDEGFTVLVVSDSGTPGISDPGNQIVRMARELQLDFRVLPGATALIPAVVASGFLTKEFVFLGFLPVKKGRNKALQTLQSYKFPVVLYESIHRLPKLQQELGQFVEDCFEVCVCQEITKKFEAIWIGSPSQFASQQFVQKGELVIVLNPCFKLLRKNRAVIA